MNDIRQRIKNLRLELLKRNLDAWYISGTDPHSSEYLTAAWQTREYISGFTGSWGVVVVTNEEAGLWTDSRYFIQAQEQLKGTGIKMHKLRVPDAVPPELWLAGQLSGGSKVGFDPRTVSVNDYRRISSRLNEAGIDFVETPDLFDRIWIDRPGMPENKIFELPVAFSGVSRKEKREIVLSELKKYDADFHLITANDELAWLFNLRGSDIPYNPLFMGFGIVGKSEFTLFVEPVKVSAVLRAQLEKDKVKLKGYDELPAYLKTIENSRIYADPSTTNYFIYKCASPGNKITEGTSLIAKLKAVKNRTELSGFREAMRKDGAALIKFLFWLKNIIKKETITEYTIGQKLNEFRSKQDKFMGDSFAPIVGYREHGAIVHLSVGENDALQVKPEGILLIDSGGHYMHGTTDITRTISLGKITDRQKRDFTLVLKGMIALSSAIFPEGTKGAHIDILARKALWKEGLNYGHGTGHGVGHFLNVHEGPASVRQEFNDNPIMPGMVFSNEPGLYREGEYGIRTENLIVCVLKKVTEFGFFMGFDTLTLFPVDLNLIDMNLIDREEKEWINSYHRVVREDLSPLLSQEYKDFLEELTAEI
jgi:Xaa-Pro aminopeptidase